MSTNDEGQRMFLARMEEVVKSGVAVQDFIAQHAGGFASMFGKDPENAERTAQEFYARVSRDLERGRE